MLGELAINSSVCFVIPHSQISFLCSSGAVCIRDVALVDSTGYTKRQQKKLIHGNTLVHVHPSLHINLWLDAAHSRFFIINFNS